MSLTRGEVVEADPENWLIADGKLYMFGKPVGPKLFESVLPRASSAPTGTAGCCRNLSALRTSHSAGPP
jgi:hypothetical protein